MKSILFISLFSVLLLCGCQNTVKGFGQDMQKNGQEIQKSADSA